MQAGLVALLLVLLLGIGKELADVLFTLANILVQDFGTVDDLGLPGVQHLANLPGNKRFSCSGRPVEQHALHVHDTELLDKPRGEDARGEGTAEDGGELGIEASDAHILELEVGANDGVGGRSLVGGLEVYRRPGVLEEVYARLVCENTPGARVAAHRGPFGLFLLHGEVHQSHRLDMDSQGDVFDIEQQPLPGGEDLVLEVLDEQVGKLVLVVRSLHKLPRRRKANLNTHGAKVCGTSLTERVVDLTH